MRRLQFSLLGLLGVVSFVAIGCGLLARAFYYRRERLAARTAIT